MVKLFAVFVVCAGLVFGQAQAVNPVSGPPPFGTVQQYYFNGSNQPTYICSSSQFAPTTTFAIGGSPAFTNIVVLSNVGTITFGATAQFWVGQQLTVAASTTAALNATYKVQTVSGSTVTITTVGVADATYSNAAMTVSTSEPLLNASLWSIQVFNYPTANLGTSYWGGNPQGNTIPAGLKCSDRSNY